MANIIKRKKDGELVKSDGKSILNVFDREFKFPRLDIQELDGHIKVTAEIPDIEKRDLKIRIENNILTIEAEAKKEHEEKKKDYYLSECAYSSFHRAIVLPATINDKAKAEFKKGRLVIDLQKGDDSKNKAIEVKI